MTPGVWEVGEGALSHSLWVSSMAESEFGSGRARSARSTVVGPRRVRRQARLVSFLDGAKQGWDGLLAVLGHFLLSLQRIERAFW